MHKTSELCLQIGARTLDGSPLDLSIKFTLVVKDPSKIDTKLFKKL